MLSPDEENRASRFHFPLDRERFIIARGALRYLLTRYLQLPAREVRFHYGPQGKPTLDPPSFSFNVSHTQNIAVFAVAAAGRNVGIDVEKAQHDFKVREIAERYFSVSECAELFSLPADLQNQAFFRCWTRKEAYLKASGEGLHTPLDSFSVSLTPSEPASFRRGVDSKWQVLDFTAYPNHPAALVYDGSPVQCVFYTLEPPALDELAK